MCLWLAIVSSLFVPSCLLSSVAFVLSGLLRKSFVVCSVLVTIWAFFSSVSVLVSVFFRLLSFNCNLLSRFFSGRWRSRLFVHLLKFWSVEAFFGGLLLRAFVVYSRGLEIQDDFGLLRCVYCRLVRLVRIYMWAVTTCSSEFYGLSWVSERLSWAVDGSVALSFACWWLLWCDLSRVLFGLQR